MSREEKVQKNIGVVHAIAIGKNCGVEFMNYRNAQALAAKHAKKYGHLVIGEVALAFEYDGRQPGKTPDAR